MHIHIDKAGRLVLPKSVRQQLGITPQTALEIVTSGDGVLLRRAADRPAMQEVGGLWIHQGASTPAVDWNKVVDYARDERADATWGT